MLIHTHSFRRMAAALVIAAIALLPAALRAQDTVTGNTLSINALTPGEVYILVIVHSSKPAVVKVAIQ